MNISTKLRGVPFSKMTGSGNDFVFFDGRDLDVAYVTSPQVVAAICNRHNGIGADGIVVLEPATEGVDDAEVPASGVRIHYFNSDGSPADLCGNATLCATSMAIESGLGDAAGTVLFTPAGRIESCMRGGLPEIALPPITEWRSDVDIDLGGGEQRMGFAVAGIPHLVVLCVDVAEIDLTGRGPYLRWHPEAGSAGANANWVSPRSDGSWRYRTFERGVEGETLACGTGAVATAVLLNEWGLASSSVTLRTSSGRNLEIRLAPTDTGFSPSLRGEGRVVFRGQIGDLSEL